MNYLKKLVSLEPQLNDLRLQDKLEEQIHFDMQKVSEPAADKDKDSTQAMELKENEVTKANGQTDDSLVNLIKKGWNSSSFFLRIFQR